MMVMKMMVEERGGEETEANANAKQAGKQEKKRHAMIKQGAMIEEGKKSFNQQ